MSPSPTPRFSSSTLAGRYAIGQKLGTGAFGSVYLAHDAERGHAVALKLIRPERLSAAAVTRLKREFRAIAALDHANIARAFDFGYADDGTRPFYTREYVAGSPLAAGPPPSGRDLGHPEAWLEPILRVLDALAYLHASEVLHLDIHPGNVIVTDRPDASTPPADSRQQESHPVRTPHPVAGRTVLIDFGLLRSRAGALVSSEATTLPAIPPELVHGLDASVATDVFLTGRLLQYRLTGHQDDEARLPREIPGWGTRLTLQLERIVLKATQIDPKQRFSSVTTFRDALVRALGATAGTGVARWDAGTSGAAIADGGAGPAVVTLGRAAELGAVDRFLVRLAEREERSQSGAGQTQVLALTGSTGIGKSHMLDEVRVRAQLRGLKVIHVNARSGARRDRHSFARFANRPCSMMAQRTGGWMRSRRFTEAPRRNGPSGRRRRTSPNRDVRWSSCLTMSRRSTRRAVFSQTLSSQKVTLGRGSNRAMGRQDRARVLARSSSSIPHVLLSRGHTLRSS